MRWLPTAIRYGSLIILCLWAVSPAEGYRPYDSTDADVVDKGEIEAEIGIFQYAHEDGLDELVAPSLVLNYGLTPRWELVGEVDLQVYKQEEERNIELLNPALLLKWLCMEGKLQGKPGPSVAFEFGALFPSTVVDERTLGFEGIGIMSYRMDSLQFHLNLGVELDRKDRNASLLWGVIAEYDLTEDFRLGIELNGAGKEQEFPETSGLVGLVWDLKTASFDLGIRRGLSSAASDWEVTAGMTISFNP
jgi:hypothetical protein